MGKILRFRRRSKWSRAKAYRSPLIRRRRAKWHKLAPLAPALLLVLLIALWYLPFNGVLAHANFLPWVAKPTARDAEAAWFQRCSGPAAARYTCVVDGDTIYYRGENIRVLGYDTPELFSPQCASEEAMAEQATEMLIDLLNAGPFSITKPTLSQGTDRYGRSLRHITREGVSLGEGLIAAGLAHRYGGGVKQGWCR